jgi:hypothetical protein
MTPAETIRIPMNPIIESLLNPLPFLPQFGMDAAKAMLIDCTKIGLRTDQSLESIWPDGKVDLSLRNRTPENELEKEQKRVMREVDQW